MGYVKEAEKLERNDSKINLHILLKKAATKKFRLRICAYSLWEYLYILTKNGLTLKHRTFAINQSDDDILEWEINKQYLKKDVWYIGGKKGKQTGGAIPLGLLASIGAPILGEIAKPILGKFFGRGRKHRRRRRRREKK